MAVFKSLAFFGGVGIQPPQDIYILITDVIYTPYLGYISA
jgi:hypothetical protein